MANSIENIKSCPHCNSTMGYYRKVFVSGWIREETGFDDSKYADNTEIWDRIKYRKEGKWAYCIECHKRIFKFAG